MISIRKFHEGSALTFLTLALAAACFIPFSFQPDWRFIFLGMSVPAHFPVFIFLGLPLLMFVIYEVGTQRTFPFFFLGTSIFLGALLLSSLVSPVDRGAALKSTIGILLRGIIPGWSAYLLARHFGREQFIRLTLIFMAGLMAFGAIFEIVSGRYFLLPRAHIVELFGENYPPHSGVAVGPIGQPLALASFLLLILPVSLGQWIQKRNWIYLLVNTLVVLGLILTYRRTGYILMVVTFLIIFWNAGKLKLMLMSILGIAFFIGILVSISPLARHHMSLRFSPTTLKHQLLASHRHKSYATTLKIVLHHPFLGVGPRQYSAIHHQYAYQPDALDSPDNQFLKTLAEGGVIGVAALLVFLTSCIFPIWKNIKKSRTYFFYSLSFLNFILAQMIFDVLYWPALQSTAFVLFAIASVPQQSTQSKNHDQETV